MRGTHSQGEGKNGLGKGCPQWSAGGLWGVCVSPRGQGAPGVGKGRGDTLAGDTELLKSPTNTHSPSSVSVES